MQAADGDGNRARCGFTITVKPQPAFNPLQVSISAAVLVFGIWDGASNIWHGGIGMLYLVSRTGVKHTCYVEALKLFIKLFIKFSKGI